PRGAEAAGKRSAHGRARGPYARGRSVSTTGYRGPLTTCRSPGYPLTDCPEAPLDDLIQIKSGGVDHDRVGGRFERGNGALGVVLVPTALVFEDVGELDCVAFSGQFRVATAGPGLVGGGEEELHRGGGKDDRSDVGPAESGTARR